MGKVEEFIKEGIYELEVDGVMKLVCSDRNASNIMSVMYDYNNKFRNINAEYKSLFLKGSYNAEYTDVFLSIIKFNVYKHIIVNDQISQLGTGWVFVDEIDFRGDYNSLLEEVGFEILTEDLIFVCLLHLLVRGEIKSLNITNDGRLIINVDNAAYISSVKGMLTRQV